MSRTFRARIGYLSPESTSSPHVGNFRHLVPDDVHVEFVGLELVKGSLYDLKGAAGAVVDRASELVKAHGWQGVVVSGGPLEVLNPGLLQQVQAAVRVPVAMPLTAVSAAFKALSVKHVLLMTAFDDHLNGLIREHLAREGFEVTAPPALKLRAYTDALKIGPEEVFSMTKKALAAAPKAQALYFQGPVLDPLKVLERMERELQRVVVVSTLTMLWFVLSKLGLTYHIRGGGQLLERWYQLPEGRK